MVCLYKILNSLLLTGAVHVLAVPLGPDSTPESFASEVAAPIGPDSGPVLPTPSPKDDALVVGPLGEPPSKPSAEDEVTTDSPVKRAIPTTRRITIINATPYRFLRREIGSHQVAEWQNTWPKYIESGQVHTSITSLGTYYTKEENADVRYEIEHTCKNMTFQVVYNPDRVNIPTVAVKFGNHLKTRHQGTGSVLNLGPYVLGGGVNFALVGTEDDFMAHETPVGWMQEQISYIGDRGLNEIVMPRSHHAGMSKATMKFGLGFTSTTLTQTQSPYEQMKKGGVRVLDFRPYQGPSRGFEAGHFSHIAGGYHGIVGLSLKDIMKDINRFLDENPGELVILDIHDQESWSSYPDSEEWGGILPQEDWRPLDDKARRRLFNQLLNLKHRFALTPGSKDVHKMKLNKFIGKGKSAVLIHVPDQWTRDPSFPGVPAGFVSNANFPRTPYWSNTEYVDELVSNQVATLKSKKASGSDGRIHDSQFVLRLNSIDYVIPSTSITHFAREAWGRLYSGLWEACNDKIYPNWISMDAIETQELKMLAMILNKCMVAQKCGKLNGKLPLADPLPPQKCKAKGRG